MGKVIPHYRVECVNDFQHAQDGSINLQEYSENFQHAKKIKELQKELSQALQIGISLESTEKIACISRLLEHEVSRALFPYRYTRYGASIFGSARLQKGDLEFKEVTNISRGIVEASRVDIITGGGPGIMEAANLGLKQAKTPKTKRKGNISKNNGILVNLPFEKYSNNHIDIESSHSTFGTRLNEFADKSNSTISWDGGGGTDLENAYVFQLKQVKHLEEDFPIILKQEIWKKIQEAKMNAMYHERLAEQKQPLVSPQDLNLITFVNHPDDAIQEVLDHYKVWKKKVWNKLDDASQEIILAT